MNNELLQNYCIAPTSLTISIDDANASWLATGTLRLLFKTLGRLPLSAASRHTLCHPEQQLSVLFIHS
jgi:hypothetical protein